MDSRVIKNQLPGTKLRLLRNQIGVSQKEMSVWLKCAPSTIPNYESGKSDIPFPVIRKFMKHGVSVKYFIKSYPLVRFEIIVSLRKAISKSMLPIRKAIYGAKQYTDRQKSKDKKINE